MKTSLPSGQAHGWGIAGKYLKREIARLPFLEEVTLHCIAGHELRPMNPADWNRVNIGYCFFENDIQIMEHTQRAAREWDFIVAGSSWCENHLRKGGVQQTATILQGIDPSFFHPAPYRPDDDKFIVFSGGKFEYRKGQDLVIAALRKFMQRHENVRLVCSWVNAWPFSLQTMKQSPHIAFRFSEHLDCLTLLSQTLQENGISLDRVYLAPLMDNALMRDLFCQTDIGLFPNRCEGGNNMVMCEYMACGRTVIASAKTGHADIITEQNSFPLRQDSPVQFFSEGRARGNWHEASLDEIGEKLEFAYQNREICRQKGAVAAEDMKKLAWDKAARKFHALGERLLADVSRKPKYTGSKAGNEEHPSFSAKKRSKHAPLLTGQNKLQEGREIYRQALEFHKAGDLEKAILAYDRVISLMPDQAQVYYHRAVALKILEKNDEALASFDRALDLQPTYAEAHNGRGITLQALGRNHEALCAYEQATAVRPAYAEAHYNKANMLVALGRYEDALAIYNLVVVMLPSFDHAHNNRGSVLMKLGKSGEALAAFDRTIAINPAYAMAHNSRGVLLHEQGRFEEALVNFDRAIALEPLYAEACNNRGNALLALERHEEALASFDLALAVNPSYAKAYYNRGVVLQTLGKYEEALIAFDRAILLQPSESSAYDNRGSVLQILGKYEEALIAYNLAIEKDATNNLAYWNKSLLLLLLGNYREGWRLYEKRKHLKDYHLLSSRFPQPPWSGDEDIRGKTILLYHEQGFGDTLQMLRYLPLLAQKGAQMVLEIPESLFGLVEKLPGVKSALTPGQDLPEFDYHCPFMSLPLAFQTTLETIPSLVPYLKAPDKKTKEWQERLGKKCNFRIGLAWSGRKTHANDPNRSLSLFSLRPLLENESEFHSLQVEYRNEEKEFLTVYKDRIKDHAGEIADFGDTAALMQEMDLIVSVDTAVAHLAGALAKTVWILLPYVPDFRWLIHREDSPWYPTARLFRRGAGESEDEFVKKGVAVSVEKWLSSVTPCF